jgi:hypothetical protein
LQLKGEESIVDYSFHLKSDEYCARKWEWWWWGCEILADWGLNISWGVEVRWGGCYIMKRWTFKVCPSKQHGWHGAEASRVGGGAHSKEGFGSSSIQAQMEEKVEIIGVRPSEVGIGKEGG